MRTTRHLAKVAVAAIVVTSVVGFVVPPPAFAVPSAQSGLLWLERELNNNGGTMPSPFGGVDWGLTSDTILALNFGGRGAESAATTATTELAAHINDYITGESFGDTGSHYAGPIGKSMLAAELQGADINSFGGVDLEALSRDRIKQVGIDAGRFSDFSIFGDFSNGFGQALNVLALSGTTAGVPPNAVDFLLAQQCPAGGFRLDYGDPPATAGCTSDAEADTDATALALDALLALDPNPATSLAIGHAASWLISQQDPATGGFGGKGPTAAPNSNTTGLVVQALDAAGFGAAAARGRAYIGSLQLADLFRGSPALGEQGAIAHDQGALSDALGSGISTARDQWRRATAQAVLGLIVVTSTDPVVVPPSRLMDTRPGATTVDGLQAGGGLVPAGSTLVLHVVGRAGVPADAAGVVLNVTAEGGQGPGFVTVYPCGSPRPLASSLNFVAGTPVANLVISGITNSLFFNDVCMFVSTNAVNLIADVNGYFPNLTGFSPLLPARLLDTRPGELTVDGTQMGAGMETAGSTLVLPVAGRGGVPADAHAVVLNVTATNGQGPGVVTAYPCDSPQPLASNLNFVAGTTTANTVITKLSASGTVCLYVGTNGVDLIADVGGYFRASSDFNALTPARLLDTRPAESTIDGAQAGGGLTGAGSTLVLPVAGRGGVPAGAASVVLNVTAVDGQGPGFLTVYPCDSAQPLASNLNFVAATATPNAVVTRLSAAGTVCVFVGTSPVNLVADVSGYFG